MSKKKHLVIKPLHQIKGVENMHELNLEILRLAVFSQVQLEISDNLMDYRDEFNRKFNRSLTNHRQQTEGLQEKIYNDYYTSSQNTLKNTEQVVDETAKLLLQSSLEDIYDILGLMVIKKLDKINNQSQVRDLLIKNNEAINDYLNPKENVA